MRHAITYSASVIWDSANYDRRARLAEGKVIFLYRADRAAQLASWRKACETGIWYQGQAVPHKVPFLENANETIDLAETLFAQHAGVTLSYEKLVQDWSRSIAAILELAGWEDVPLGKALEKQK